MPYYQCLVIQTLHLALLTLFSWVGWIAWKASYLNRYCFEWLFCLVVYYSLSLCTRTYVTRLEFLYSITRKSRSSRRKLPTVSPCDVGKNRAMWLTESGGLQNPTDQEIFDTDHHIIWHTETALNMTIPFNHLSTMRLSSDFYMRSLA